VIARTVQPFPLGQVTLGPGLFADKARLMHDHLRGFDPDRLLRAFRMTAGLPIEGVTAPGGWEDTSGEANGNLRGHYTGHFLSALSQAYASTRDPAYGEKIAYLVDGLMECREALQKLELAPSHPGFLAAYPETQFVQLETMAEGDYTVVWAPYYTAHKILRGLLDAYESTGNGRALELAEGLGSWMYSRLRRLSPAVLQRMWSLHGTGEYGGLAEAVCDLYAVTGDAELPALGRLLDLDSLIDACVEGRDIFDGMHANQHIPILIGLVRLAETTGEPRYLTAATNFWDQIIPARTYSIGGTSTKEFWAAAGSIAGTLTDTNAETCCAHNLLKLSRLLFFHQQDPRYVDYYERALYNQILGSKQDEADPERPRTTYFIGLEPGSVRNYLPKDGATCCEGTGLESATKYQDSIYFRASDDSGLYVNLYSASTVGWKVRVTQRTEFPVEQGTTLRIEGEGTFDLHLRVPQWATDGFLVTINGLPHPVEGTPGNYLTISREWLDGDTVHVAMPFPLTAEPTPDDPEMVALRYGPISLVALDPRRTFLELDPRKLTPLPGRPLHFELDGIEFAPFYEGNTKPYHAYFRRSVGSGADGGPV
jgi:DUF1680 family protein